MIEAVINLIIFALFLWFLAWFTARIAVPAARDARNFRLFAIRDRLAFLAMSGSVSQDTREFRTLMALINDQIMFNEDDSITGYLRRVLEFDRNPELRKYVESVIAVVKDLENPEYAAVVADLFEESYRGYQQKTWLLRWFVFPMLYPVVKAAIYLLRIFLVAPSSLAAMIERKREIIHAGKTVQQFQSLSALRPLTS